jgi:hypothetical protein
MIIDLELEDTSLGPRHRVKSWDGRHEGGVTEFCSWQRLADELLKNTTNPFKYVRQIKVDADGIHYILAI